MSYPYYTPFKKYLTKSQMQENAKYFAQIMLNRGWSINAIAAAFGNWQSEATLNTNLPQKVGYPEYRYGGFGLPQWTPWWWKYGKWCRDNNIQSLANDDNPAADFEKQLDYHDYECAYGFTDPDGEHSATWINRGGYSYTWSQFKAATDDVQEMAKAYYWQYERSGAQSVGNRADHALEWYNFLGGGENPPPTPPPTPSGADFISLQIETINITQNKNLLNVTTKGTFPLEIYATTNKNDEIELEFDVTKLYVQVWQKVAGSESTYYVIDSFDYNFLPNPSIVVISNDNTNNLIVTHNGNNFKIKGRIYKPLNANKYVPSIPMSTIGLGILYEGSVTYGGQTLTTTDYYTYINLYINLSKRKKPWLMALKQRRFY